MRSAYRYGIIYFTLFSLLLLLSGWWLFGMKIGFSIEAVTHYYLGNELEFVQPKSSLGLLEVAVPHLGAMGLFIMVTAHFLMFTRHHCSKAILWVTGLLFLSAVINIFAPFGIIAGYSFLVEFKLAAFFLLQLLGLYLVWLVFKSAISKER